MNEPEIPQALPCYTCTPWPRFPVIGPALVVVVAVLAALLLISNAHAFSDVGAELRIAALDKRVADREAERLAKVQVARRILVADGSSPRAGAHASAGMGAGADTGTGRSNIGPTMGASLDPDMRSGDARGNTSSHPNPGRKVRTQ
ncbi:hypothetical protein CDN99_01685 [Roseateles aquatilis]|uniref:Uncharacterized protein n=1 Tax=Roseateles aquatilis TaxID=431061 RepID=A0A246JKR5_9BURK|nr:hypothetical protein [Roseateles aquatilis]OWQ93228.1 hypothetical protein CDN99_01685 [Roseateles aquatilis]